MTVFSLWIDESEKGNFLSVGGILVELNYVPRLINEWRHMKFNLGVAEDAEFKWNIGRDHPVRRAIESSRFTTRGIREKAIEFIAGNNELFLIIVLMFDERKEFWKFLYKKNLSGIFTVRV